MKKIVSILGCGWVGKALKVSFSSNFVLKCASRDVELNKLSNFYTCDVLVIAIPARDFYINVIKDVFLHIKKETKVILLSSISFYNKKSLVVEAEKIVNQNSKNYVILRLGGLMGYDRIAGKYTGGKTILNTKTNYVHRDDVVGIIKMVIEKEINYNIFDVVAPIQCSKKELFAQNGQKFGFEKTYFEENRCKERQISADKIVIDLGYNFLREDVAKFWD